MNSKTNKRYHPTERILEWCEAASKDMKTFYRQQVVYQASSRNTISEFLLKNPNLWNDIKTLTRQKSYKCERPGVESGDKLNAAKEAWLAMSMYTCSDKTGHEYDAIGKVIAYQTPSENVPADNTGDVDLMAWSSKENILYLIELKASDNEESFFHGVLQICTYYQLLNREKLLADFEKPQGSEIIPVVAIFKKNNSTGRDSTAYRHLIDPKYSRVIDLMNSRGVKVALLSGDIGKELDGSKIKVEWWTK